MDNLGNIDLAFDKMNDYTERMKMNGRLGFDSPYPELDKLTKGIIPGKVYTIGSYSNVGKSKFSYNYVNNFVSQGLKVLFFSLEVDTGMLLLNLISNKERLSFSKVEYGVDFDRREYYNLKLYDTVYEMDKIEEIIIKESPDVVFIDFVQNIIESGSEYEKMAKIARKIQKAAITTNSSIFSLSQLSNSVGKDVSQGRTDFVSLKGAGEFFASSDVIFILRRGDDNEIILKVQKNKYGPAGSEHVFKVDFGMSLFEYDRDFTF